jgi:hypothetical protein
MVLRAASIDPSVEFTLGVVPSYSPMGQALDGLGRIGYALI